jgi:hypothetical protein
VVTNTFNWIFFKSQKSMRPRYNTCNIAGVLWCNLVELPMFDGRVTAQVTNQRIFLYSAQLKAEPTHRVYLNNLYYTERFFYRELLTTVSDDAYRSPVLSPGSAPR